MALVEVKVELFARGRTLREGLKFRYVSTSPYFNLDTGDIILPAGSGEHTLLFTLASARVQGLDACEFQACPVSFHLGAHGNGHDVLGLWREDDPEKNHPASVFSYPALSGGDRRSGHGHNTVSSTDYNYAPGRFRYCLSFGIDLGNGTILKVDNDPHIKNDGMG